jgi:hypothetical protein
MKRILTVLAFSVLVLNMQKASAQAYDGKGDSKIFLGYANTKGYSAVQLKYEGGNSNLISMGAAWTYFFIKEDSSNIGTDDGFSNIFDRSEFDIFTNFHLNRLLQLDDRSDVYIGPFLSLQTTGIQAGYKYNFSERFGVYAEVSQGIYNIFNFVTESDSKSSTYDTRTLFSAGITFNFLR